MSDPSESEADSEAAPSKTGPKGVVLIGALVGSLLIGGAAGVFAVGPVISKKAGYGIAPAAHDSASVEESSADGAHASSGAEHGVEGSGASNMQLIDNLVLNPAASGGSRFLMLAAAIEFSDPAHVDEMKNRDSEVRDIILRVLGSKTVEQLSEMSNRDAIKSELADSLGTLFKKKKAIRRIYFPQFVIQ